MEQRKCTVNPAEIEVSEWMDFVEMVSRLEGRWHYRGILDNWHLKTSLERVAGDWGIPQKELPNLEKQLVVEFKRAYYLNAGAIALDADDTLGWLALMQHHGAPTRLLDLTYSPFVAAFFALDHLLCCEDPERKAAVWAFSIKPFEKPEKALATEELRVAYGEYQKTRAGGPFREVFLLAKPPSTHAFLVNPFLRTERLAVQQGLFVIPGNICLSFEENLCAVPQISDYGCLQKIILPRSVLPEAFVWLSRMNITSASLFPGLDGFARGLRHRAQFLLSPDRFQGTEYYGNTYY